MSGTITSPVQLMYAAVIKYLTDRDLPPDIRVPKQRDIKPQFGLGSLLRDTTHFCHRICSTVSCSVCCSRSSVHQEQATTAFLIGECIPAVPVQSHMPVSLTVPVSMNGRFSHPSHCLPSSSHFSFCTECGFHSKVQPRKFFLPLCRSSLISRQRVLGESSWSPVVASPSPVASPRQQASSLVVLGLQEW